jgi:hypothetical protein
VERTRKIFDLAESHFPSVVERDDVDRLVGDPLNIPLEPGTSFDLVLLDGGVLAGLGTLPILEESDWQFLAGAVAEGGLVVIGGLRDGGPRGGEGLAAFIRQSAGSFPEALLYGTMPGWEDSRLLPEMGGDEECLVVLGQTREMEWPPLLPGFRILPSPGD